MRQHSSESSTRRDSRKGAPVAARRSSDSMLREFFIGQLKDIYGAENHLVETLPKMQQAATSQELKDAFEDHLAVTENQVKRLEKVFELLDEKPEVEKCEAMEGITKECDEVIENTAEDTATRDVGLIIAAQKVEHYEIAAYGGLAQLAYTLGEEDVAEILDAILEEEKDADASLTEIAENDINYEAGEEGEEGEEEDEDFDEDSETDEEDEDEETV